jgi:hypothetical protein
VQLVSVLVDHELPEAVGGRRCPEVLEVEGQHWQSLAFSERHDSGVGVSETEIGELGIPSDGSLEKRRRARGDGVLAGGKRSEKQPRRRGRHARPQQLIHLDDDSFRDQEVPTELCNQCSGEGVRSIAAIGRRDQRARIGDDFQRVSIRSLR